MITAVLASWVEIVSCVVVICCVEIVSWVLVICCVACGNVLVAVSVPRGSVTKAVSVARGSVLIAVVVKDKVEVIIWVLVPPGSVDVKINTVVAVAVSVARGRVCVRDRVLAP